MLDIPVGASVTTLTPAPRRQFSIINTTDYTIISYNMISLVQSTII